MPRFTRAYCPSLPTAPESLQLEGDEAHHLARVLRIAVGDEVELFDGLGAAISSRVQEVGKRSVLLATHGEVRRNPVPAQKLAVAIAPPKKDFDDTVVRLAELGVDVVIPLQSRFAEVDPSKRGEEAYAERMHALAVRACKQSGLNRLIEVQVPRPPKDIEGSALVCDPAGIHLSGLPTARDGDIILLIGPEGGWDAAEYQLFDQRGWPKIALPGGVLRTMTASIAAASILLASMRDGK